MKSLLCRFGLHKADKNGYVRVEKSRQGKRGTHKWHTNYAVCKRCGKLLFRVKLTEKVGDTNGK